jgi:hypothetical protein
MEIELNKHKIELQDREIVCTECDRSERIPDIFYRDSAALVRKYKYYALGKVTQDKCEEAVPEGFTSMMDENQDTFGVVTGHDITNIQDIRNQMADYKAQTAKIRLSNGEVIAVEK